MRWTSRLRCRRLRRWPAPRLEGSQLAGAALGRLKLSTSVMKNAHGAQRTAGSMSMAAGTPDPAFSATLKAKTSKPIENDQNAM